MAISFPQTPVVNDFGSAQSTLSVSLGVGITAGDLIVVAGSFHDGATGRRAAVTPGLCSLLARTMRSRCAPQPKWPAIKRRKKGSVVELPCHAEPKFWPSVFLGLSEPRGKDHKTRRTRYCTKGQSPSH
jgi:hypothetical protein